MPRTLDDVGRDVYKLAMAVLHNAEALHDVSDKMEKLDRVEDRTDKALNMIGGLATQFTAFERDFASFRKHVGDRFDKVDQRFEKVDQRLDKIDERLDKMDQRFDKVEQRLDKMDERFDKVDGRFDGIEGMLRQLVGASNGKATPATP